MYQLICGLALAGLVVGSAQSNDLTFVKEDDAQARLVIPENSTATVYRNQEKLVSGNTILDEENAKNLGRNAIRLKPEENSACPPVVIFFSKDQATLEVQTDEMQSVRGAGSCAMQAIAGRYQLKRDSDESDAK